MSFWKKLIIGNLVCIKTCYSFKPVKILSMIKDTNLKTLILWNHLWLMPWGMWTKNYPFSGTLLSHNPLFGQKWYKQLWTEMPSFQSYPHTEKWFSNLKGLLRHVSLPGAYESLKKKEQKNNNCHVMHLKNSIKPKWESRMSKKWWKIA